MSRDNGPLPLNGFFGFLREGEGGGGMLSVSAVEYWCRLGFCVGVGGEGG